jgi:hypothetical protein
MGMLNSPLHRWTVRTFRSVSEIGELEQSLYATQAGNSGQSWGFRGQPACYGCLAPGFLRFFPKSESKLIPIRIETEMIRSFRSHYSRLYVSSSGLPEPDSIAGDQELACLSVMQHYGVPTRMLDWTTAIWVALFFACASEPEQDGELWIYDRRVFANKRRMPDETATKSDDCTDRVGPATTKPPASIADLNRLALPDK